jgi:hypothetical protein
MDTPAGRLPRSSGSLAGHEVKYITLLSLTEIGVGSLVHGLKIPMGGHTLSLNQGFVLMQSTRALAPHVGQVDLARSASNVSLLTALMKSFSPAGKKLTPMLAITVQGLLFATGVLIGGASFAGLALGMILLSVWGFAQPLLMAWLFVGAHFWESIDMLWSRIADPLGLESVSALSMILFFVFIKALIAVSLVFVSQKIGERWNEGLAKQGQKVLQKRKRKSDLALKSRKANILATLRDLTSPLVVISVILSVVFAVYSDSSEAGLVWALMRPLAAAFVGFYLLRVFPTEKIVHVFAKNNPARAELIRKVSESIERFAR